MAQEQAPPEGRKQPCYPTITCKITLGGTTRALDMSQHQISEALITAIWRNEVGPADLGSRTVDLR